MKMKAFREAAGLTQAELAEKVGVTVSSICCWETGLRYPAWKLIPAIERATGGLVQANDFVPRDIPPHASKSA